MRANYAGNVTLIDEQIGSHPRVFEVAGELDGPDRLYFGSRRDEWRSRPDLQSQFPGPRHPGSADHSATRRGARRDRELNVVAELMDVGATIVDYAGGSPLICHTPSRFGRLIEESADRTRGNLR